mmetsp:Transcript_53114/g.79387  ORF Transcript_53114/g.79387 Transcript_53114/m.79387 type:complete len:279 (-) Transcript_53114:351-1187(-)
MPKDIGQILQTSIGTCIVHSRHVLKGKGGRLLYRVDMRWEDGIVNQTDLIELLVNVSFEGESMNSQGFIILVMSWHLWRSRNDTIGNVVQQKLTRLLGPEDKRMTNPCHGTKLSTTATHNTLQLFLALVVNPVTRYILQEIVGNNEMNRNVSTFRSRNERWSHLCPVAPELSDAVDTIQGSLNIVPIVELFKSRMVGVSGLQSDWCWCDGRGRRCDGASAPADTTGCCLVGRCFNPWHFWFNCSLLNNIGFFFHCFFLFWSRRVGGLLFLLHWSRRLR